MIIEQPPKIIRRLFPKGIFRINPMSSTRRVYLTFDDGPIPEATPLVLDILDRYGIKATFFMVGDNARKYPYLLEEVKKRGHSIGNHTMHHLQGSKVRGVTYMRDVCEADSLLKSPLFRPPHGWLRRSQARALEKHYKIIMYDLVTRDYSKYLDARDVVKNVMKYARPGSIIVFHDSLKSLPKLEEALTESIEWLQSEGYDFGLIEEELKAGNI